AGATSRVDGMCSRGTTSTCVGACGSRSSNATARSFSNTNFAGSSRATILQKRQLASFAIGPASILRAMAPAAMPERLLLGPGPSNVCAAVREALARPLVGHLDPAFLALLDEMQGQLRRVFKSADAFAFPLSGTGSAGMEACLVNLLEPGETA